MATEREAIERLWKVAATAGGISVILQDGCHRWHRGISLGSIFKNREPALQEFYWDIQAAKEVHEQCPGMLQSMFRDLSDTSYSMLAATLPERLEDFTQPTFLSFYKQLRIDSDRLRKACDAALGDDEAIAIAAPESEVGKIVAQVTEFGGEELGKIMGIMNSPKLSADAKMRQAAAIDPRVFRYDSPHWAKLTGKTDAAIRKTDFWKVDRPKFIEQSRETFAAENPGEAFPNWLQ